MFASGKTFTLSELIQAVDAIIANPAVISDPKVKDKLDWLFAHFDHQLDFDEWARTLPTPPTSTAYKQLLLSHPDWLKTALQKILAADVTITPPDIKLSAPHEAYLRLHATRLGLDDSQTQVLIDQQKQAAAAKAIDDLTAQGVTTPDKAQIQAQIQARINWTNRHTASLQRQVLHHDNRITDQLHQSFQRVINSQPTTIPQSEITSASRELASLSYQTLKPYISKVSSAADLVNVLKSDILTPDRISRTPTLAAYKIPPDLFHQALEIAANNLYRRYIKPAQQANNLVANYGEYDYHNVSSATPPPADHLHYSARADFLTHGYPGESLLNALDPHAAENLISSIPHKVWNLTTSPIRLVFGEVQTSLYSAYFTNHREQVQLWAINKSFSILDPQLQNQWQNLFNQAHAAHKPIYQLSQFDSLMQNTQVWIRTQVQALHEGRLTLDFDTREKLLEANNNLNLLQLAHAHRHLLEKIPLVKSYYGLINRLSSKISPIYLSYLQSWAQLAFRSGDPLQATFLLVEYGAIRPAAAALWRAAIVPWSRHLPFGWDVKQGTYGQEVYWKPAKWAKDNIKQGLGWLAEKTGARRIAEAISQKIFKTTFAKLAAAFTGIATGFLIAWGALKKSIKATAGLLFLFLITHGLPTALAAAIGGGLTAFFAAGLATTGLVLLGVTSPLWLAVAALVTFAIVLPLAALFWGFMYLKSIGALSALGSWLASLPAWASQLLPALSTIAFPTLAPWLVPAITGGLIFYQIYQTNLRNTALMAPALGGAYDFAEDIGELQHIQPGDLLPACTPSGSPFAASDVCVSGYEFNQRALRDENDPGRGAYAHAGIDLQSPSTLILASIFPCSVTAYFFESDRGLGNRVALVSGNIAIVYGHLSEIGLTANGQAVATDDPIGIMGATGNTRGAHLHLEVRRFNHPPTPQEALRDSSSGTIVDPAEIGIDPPRC